MLITPSTGANQLVVEKMGPCCLGPESGHENERFAWLYSQFQRTGPFSLGGKEADRSTIARPRLRASALRRFWCRIRSDGTYRRCIPGVGIMRGYAGMGDPPSLESRRAPAVPERSAGGHESCWTTGLHVGGAAGHQGSGKSRSTDVGGSYRVWRVSGSRQ